MKALLFVCLGLWAGLSWAGESAEFLKLGVGARAQGLGGAYTSLADDLSALHYNPAGLSLLNKRELGVTHAELPSDTRYDFLGYAQPTRYGTLSAGALYVNRGKIQGRDGQGREIGGFGASDMALSLGYAKSLTSALGLGGTFKYVSSAIAEASASSFALDLGSQYRESLGPGKASVGLALQNLGPGRSLVSGSEPLPLTLAAGTGYRLPVGLTLALDYKHRPYARSSELGVGTEYALIPSLAVRAGYSGLGAKSSGSALKSLDGFAAGFGVKARGYSLDYSMTPFGELGQVQRLSLGARW